jgi:hypothetical protein
VLVIEFEDCVVVDSPPTLVLFVAIQVKVAPVGFDVRFIPTLCPLHIVREF